VIDIKQHSLRPFEQDARAGLAHFLQSLPHRLGKLQHEGRNLAQVCQQAFAVNRRLIETGAQSIMMRTETIELRFEVIEMRQVAHPDRAAADLVLIGRADSAAGGADLAATRGGLTQPVEIAVDRQNQRAIVCDGEIVVIDGDALAFELLDLRLEVPRVKHHSVANYRKRAGDNAGRKQAELVGRAIDHQRVAGIVAALETDHGIGAAGEPVNDLALAFIAPLGTDHGYVGHACASSPAKVILAALRQDSTTGWK